MSCAAGPALLQAAAETTGVWGRKIAVRRVRQCKEVGMQEWPLAGRATIPRVLYSIGPRMSLRQRTILSKCLPAPARVALTVHTLRTVEPQVVVLFSPRRLHWMANDVIDAEFAICRCNLHQFLR